MVGIQEKEVGARELLVKKLLEEDRMLSTLFVRPGDTVAGVSKGPRGSTGGRRSKQCRVLYTRLLTQYPALLDDLCPAMAQRILDNVDKWQFNAFLLDRVTGGHCLPFLCPRVLYETGLVNHFKMDPSDVMGFFRQIERGYHSGNPYHNALHASDVTQAMYVYCRQAAILPYLTPLELLAALVAAVSHDLDHPGVNEKFLVSTGSHLAVLYDNVSVLENHHWRSAVSCFIDSGLSKYLSESEFLEFTDLVRLLILATDISRQQEFLTQFQHFLDHQELNLTLQHHRHFILQIAIKCADISNPCRTWDVSKLWSLRACEEFFRQGDLERELGLGLTPICDRFNVTVAKVQVGFYSFVVEPLFKEWHRFLASDLSSEMLEFFRSNQIKWEEEIMQEEICDQLDTPPKIEPRQVRNLAPMSAASRRMSLPTNDPLLRVFDQMTQPDLEMSRSINLRRNFSLTDRRRSSLLRGLYTRSSLKPGRGRVGRPTSVCLGNADVSKHNRTLQPREQNLMESPSSMEVSNSMNTSNQRLNEPTLNPLLGSGEGREKENSGSSLKLYERLTRRRGSAPSNLVLGDCQVPNTGSIHGTNLLRQQNHLALNTRRGSLPSDLLKESLPKQFKSRIVGFGGTGSKSCGLMRRRSMGPELLNVQGGRDRQLMQKYMNRPV